MTREGQSQLLGPYNISWIITGLQSGRLELTDFCWKEGMASGTTLMSIPEFAQGSRPTMDIRPDRPQSPCKEGPESLTIQRVALSGGLP